MEEKVGREEEWMNSLIRAHPGVIEKGY